MKWLEYSIAKGFYADGSVRHITKKIIYNEENVRIAEKEAISSIDIIDDDNDIAHEWLKPPMFEDTEYRTTERYQGRPVYVKRVSFIEVLSEGVLSARCVGGIECRTSPDILHPLSFP